MDFLTQVRPRWRWSASLAAVSPDPSRIYRVEEIGGSIARKRCMEMGIVEGTRVRPKISTPDKLVLELPDDGGRLCPLEITYAWYVRVEPESGSSLPGPSPRRSLPAGAP